MCFQLGNGFRAAMDISDQREGAVCHKVAFCVLEGAKEEFGLLLLDSSSQEFCIELWSFSGVFCNLCGEYSLCTEVNRKTINFHLLLHTPYHNFCML